MTEFTLQAHFNISTKELYQLWLSSEGHAAMTGGEATISDNVGDTFEAWDGYITGKNLELIPYERIVQAWRTSDFTEDEADSKITITLLENDGVTELTLVHSSLPEHGEQYIQGWKEHYFEPMNVFIELYTQK